MGRHHYRTCGCPFHAGHARGGRNWAIALRRTASSSVLVAAALWQAPAMAQTLAEDRWISVQAYYPHVDTNVRVNANTAQTIGTDIDFEKDLDLDSEEVLPAVSAGARFGRVVVGAEFYKLKRSGSVGLARDITFDGTTYPVNAQVESGFSSNIYRLTVGYALVSKPDLEIGAALGLHATNFRFSLSGQAAAGGQGVTGDDAAQGRSCAAADAWSFRHLAAGAAGRADRPDRLPQAEDQ